MDLGGRNVLHDLDIELREGEQVVLLGPNGAGKTTLARACLGLLPLRRGWVRIHGFDPSHPDGRRCAMERTGICIEQPGLPGPVAASSYLEWWASLHGEVSPRKRVRRMLEDWGIPPDKPAERLSQGQRQILQILRALVHDPVLLVLDEPTSSLDPDSRIRIHEELERWRTRTGGALLLSTHHLDEPIESADRIVLLAEGRVRAHGSPESLSSGARLSRLLRIPRGQDPSSASRLLETAIPGVRAVPAGVSRGCPSLRVECPQGEEEHPRVVRALCEAGIGVVSIDRDATTWLEFWNRTIVAPPLSAPFEQEPDPALPESPAIRTARASWITARFQLGLILRERRLFLPVVVLEGFLLLSLALTTDSDTTSAQASSVLLLAGLLPLGLSASLAADTFAGERERRSLETLLCAPQSALPLFLGKGLSAFLPALLLSCIATGAAWIVLAANRCVLPAGPALAIATLTVPSLGILSTSLALTASRRARSVRAAAQMAALALLPIIASTQIAPPLVEAFAPGHPILAWTSFAAANLLAAGFLIARSVSRLLPERLLQVG